jgi:hypothetical protein
MHGALEMVNFVGGIQNSGLDGLLQMLLIKFIDELGLQGQERPPPCGGAYGANIAE